MSSWRARYNAACFYAIAFRIKSDSDLQDHCLRTALEQLTRAMTDPESIFAWSWVEEDPDLAELRHNNAYKSWKEHYLQPKVLPSPTEERYS